MRWLWQHGIRWATSRVVDEAKRAATNEFLGDQEEPDEQAEDAPNPVAFLCQTKFLFDAVADELASKRHFEANHLVVCTGKLTGRPVVIVRSQASSPDVPHLVAATVDGHHPRFALTLSEATALNRDIAPATVVMATRVMDGQGHTLRIDGQSPTGSGLIRGSILHSGVTRGGELTDPEHAPQCEDTWSLPLARACGTTGLPLMVAAVVLQPPTELQSKETAALKHQQSLAGKTGVLAGMLFKKRSGLRDLWNENQARWDAAVRVGELAKRLVQASG
ncbi:hypothetical protein NG895_28340 [Aeoliella sp. ICT_H6.2]|uniref:Uncharacterized protein n=1 Tax=Aeoliella straminimaris TaxID=2954799 RepID=A0A9X2JK89_9BACT|nr:hypothetical protein [Aeoliella straminimaris]MCO6047833.1 hypothetical protein [Aeoliella straminimaris]